MEPIVKVRQPLTGWIIAATCFVVAGVSAVFGHRTERFAASAVQLLPVVGLGMAIVGLLLLLDLLRHRARLATASPPDRPTSAG